MRLEDQPAEQMGANHASCPVPLAAGDRTLEMKDRPAWVLVAGVISLATGVLPVSRTVIRRREKSYWCNIEARPG